MQVTGEFLGSRAAAEQAGDTSVLDTQATTRATLILASRASRWSWPSSACASWSALEQRRPSRGAGSGQPPVQGGAA